ncbi:MAG: hypothetical protein QG597_4725 [Actinomycetota bacterium]|nr:hypothetical protein [Actinomycetota bacterium]
MTRPRRDRHRWQDIGEDDHFAGDAYVARWLDESDGTGPDGGRPSKQLWPRRRDVLSRGIDTPLWWRIWRWWR